MKHSPFLILLLTPFFSSSFAQEVSNSIGVSAGRGTNFIFEDSIGRRVGVDPLAHLEYNEIPGASYGQDGVDSEDSTVADIKNNILSYPDATSGSYFLRAFGAVQSPVSIGVFLSRGVDSGRDFYMNGATNQNGIAEFRIIYNTDTTAPLAAYQLIISPAVKGGIFNPTGGTFSVRAKSSVSFGSSDTLRTLVATVRWLTSYNISLGTISSPTYGITKSDSVVVAGSYSYQKFHATMPVPLNWAANNEYELFTVNVTAYSGIESFELTNAISGGEWFVQVNNSDKTDSTFYQSSATGFVYQNKSSQTIATWPNGSRHVVKTTGKIHEAYTSGNSGEIIYRRSSDNGSTWEVTTRITTGNGNNDASCLYAGANSTLHLVLQRGSVSTRDIYYARSTNNGTTWSTPIVPSGCSGIAFSQYQGGTFPVVSEWNSSKVVIVFCSSAGSKYLTSGNGGQSWSSVASLPPSQGGYNSRVRYLSLAPASSYLILSYDYAGYGVWSRTYNGTTWYDQEYNANASTGTISDGNSSIAIDNQNRPISAWCAAKSGQSEYRIMFRQGNTDGTWGSWFVEFAHSAGISDLLPSITWQNSRSSNAIDIIYHRTNYQVKVNKYTTNSWTNDLLSSSGLDANLTAEKSGTGYPMRIWTDQSSSPYLVTLQMEGPQDPQGSVSSSVQGDRNRRVVLQSKADLSTLTYEVQPIRVVTSTNDTVAIPFKAHDVTAAYSATITDVWDFLGTDQFTLPANARTLLVNVNADLPTTTTFTSKSYRIDLIQGTQATQLLVDQAGTSGLKQIGISQFSGQQVEIRPSGTVSALSLRQLTVGVGDVYIEKVH